VTLFEKVSLLEATSRYLAAQKIPLCHVRTCQISRLYHKHPRNIARQLLLNFPQISQINADFYFVHLQK